MSEMIHFRMNGRQIDVADGTTLLEAARAMGVEIPTLCHIEGHTPFTSCMVCMVQEKASGRFLPACSAVAEPGWIVETDNDAVRDQRRAALELLLSDHVGDCEAPCRRACPAGLNIPVLIRHVAAGELDAARAVVGDGEVCRECQGPCEKVCRRGRVDQAVAIRELIRSVVAAAPAHGPSGVALPGRRIARPPSVLGRLSSGELQQLARLASPAARQEPDPGRGVLTPEQARREAGRCLHCDCRKRVDCTLRRYAEEYAARQTRYRGESRRPFSVDAEHPRVVFEPGKCIACGICVRLAREYGDDPGLGFRGRGIDTMVLAPFEEGMAAGLVRSADACVRACPTGALAFRHDV